MGTDRGIGTEELLTRLRGHSSARSSISVGGGIRGIDDLQRLKGLGASSVLVGSAIHDGRIGAELDEIERLGCVKASRKGHSADRGPLDLAD